MATMHEFLVILRPGVIPSDPRDPAGDHSLSVRAYRFEGWAQDYAFFGDPLNNRAVTEAVPRDIVMRVLRGADLTYDDAPPITATQLPGDLVGTLHPLAKDEERACAWWNGLDREWKERVYCEETALSASFFTHPDQWWQSLSGESRIRIAATPR